MKQYVQSENILLKDYIPIVEVYKLEDINKQEFFNFCKLASLQTTDPAHKNMWSDEWQTTPSTLPNLIYVKKRLIDPKGQFYVAKVNDQIVAVAGVYISDFDSRVAIGSVRAWVTNEYRGKFVIGKYILPKQLKWAKEKNCALFFLTFNEYNKDLIKIVKRSGFGRLKNRTSDMLFFNGVKEAPYPCLVQNTKQWVVYDVIDPTYSFDWQKIKYDK
jgi:hypothetical protein